MKKYYVISIICIYTTLLTAQNITQTVKGRIIDKESHVPIEFATIYLSNTNFSSGAISDENGYYKIENVPVGSIPAA